MLSLIRILYVIAESYYNAVILDASSSMNLYLDPEPFDRLAEFGHILTSIGSALLLTNPFRRLIKKYVPPLSRKITVFVIFGVLFAGAYYSYSKLIDKVVEWKKGDSYNAYYMNLFRLEKITGASEHYSDFFAIDDNQGGKLSPDEKILLTNIVILKWADKSLVEQVREDDKALVELFKKTIEDKKNIGKRFNRMGNAEKFYAAYSAMSREVANADAGAKKAYAAMKNTLSNKYNTYIKERDRMRVEINKHLGNIDSYYSDLQSYFEYRGFSEAEQKYKKKMRKEFGRYIAPESWCSGNICPSKNAIRDVMLKEANARWDKKTGGLNQNINTFEEFVQDAGVRREIVKELRKRGLNVPDGYGLDEEPFYKAYKAMLVNKYAALCSKYLGCQIEPGLSYDKYAMIPAVKNGKVKNLNISEKELNTYVAYFKNLRFDDINKIAASSKVKLTKEDFEKDAESKEMGKRAIKALYIPPIALLFSAFCVIGNLIGAVLNLIPKKGIFEKFKPRTRCAVNTLIITIVLAILSSGVSPLLDNAFLQEKREKHKIMYFAFDRFVKVESKIYQTGLHLRRAFGKTVYNAMNNMFGI